MFRKLLAILVLGGLLYIAWYASRQIKHTEDLTATLVFDSAKGIKPDVPVVSGGKEIGVVTSVSPVGDKTAVTIKVPVEDRGQLYTDSVFEIGADPPVINVISSISVGSPIENGDVVVARKDQVSAFLAKGGEKLAPKIKMVKDAALGMIDEYDAEMFSAQLDEWAESVPEWKAQGKDALEGNVEDLRDTVTEIESALRKINRNSEADKIRRSFEDWVEDIKSDD